MAYTDYEFYKSKYFGTTIAESDFPRFAERASEKIDFLTFDRLVDGLPSDEKAVTKVQKAVCAVADVLAKIDEFEKIAGAAAGYETDAETGKLAGKIVTSKTSGRESVSYSAGSVADLKNSSLVGAVLNDKQARERLIYDVAAEYLTGICADDGIPLLYAGV